MVVADRVLLDAVRAAWAQRNAAWFDGALVPPVFVLDDAGGRWGAWRREGRQLALARRLVTTRPWGEVMAVLEHEMAHQAVHELHGVLDEGPHGATFHEVCTAHGIDSRAGGAPSTTDEPEPAVIRRVRKLLALADSPNEAEAKAATRAAWRLMLRHNLKAVDMAETRRVAVRQVGPVRARRPRHEQLLAGILSSSFFVEVTLVPAFDVATGRQGRAFEVVGTAHDVELADWVWTYVLDVAERAWRDHRKAQRLRGDAGRQAFLQGVMLGFRERLAEEADLARTEEALVWVGDPATDAVVAARYGRRRRGRRFSLRGSAALAAGRDAGRAVRLRRPIRGRADGAPAALTDRRKGG